jgi:DNA-binding beta-propeller fold protein YncE
MYALNSGDNSVSVFNTLNPAAPVLLQKLPLKNAGPTYTNSFYKSSFTTSECYSLGLSSNEKFLYVVSQHTNPDFSIGNYNYLHVLSVNFNGILSEPGEPIQLPVPNNVRPRGVAVYGLN